MNKNSQLNQAILIDDGMDFRSIFKAIWEGKIVLIINTAFFLIIAIIYSLYLPNIFQSKALLSPVIEQTDISSTMRSYGTIASLAGINLPSSANNNNSVKALDKLVSISFFAEHILPNIYLPDLMAIDYWDAKRNIIFYDDSVYDHKSQVWIRDFKFPQTQIPSIQESFKVFIEEHLNVSEDKKTGHVTISVKHQSPYLAKDWTEIIIKELNSYFRAKDKVDVGAAMEYLNEQMALTSFTEIKQVIAQLLQQKTQQQTLIEVNENYVYEYIDPPIVMEKKHSPNRFLICILALIFGGIFGIFVVLIRFFSMSNKS